MGEKEALISCDKHWYSGNKDILIDVEPQSTQNYGALSDKYFGGTSSLKLSWDNLTVEDFKTGEKILDKISGHAEAGQFIAVMGSSGSGKTTFLNTLLSRNLKNFKVEGRVFVNGNEFGEKIKYISGYVHQDELFMPTLTVLEWLRIQGTLRLVGQSRDSIENHVRNTINELGLQNCQNVRIGLSGVKKGISGGEARRLSMAAELLNNPLILFADEPTSGLDSSIAESVVNLMSKLAKDGRIIICTIHQPSSAIYLKFDRVMFLAKGRLAYFGEPKRAVEFMQSQGYPCPINYNPADALIRTLSIQMSKENECIERIHKICDGFRDSKEGSEFREAVSSSQNYDSNMKVCENTASFQTQIKTLLKRSLIDNWRNPGLAKAKIIQKFIMGIFIGLLYFQTPLTKVGINNLSGAMYYLVAELTYSTLFGVLNFLPIDYPLLVREYHNGLYSVASYYIARSASYIPLFIFDGFLMVTISYWMTGLVPTFTRFLIALGICLLVEQSAAAFGVMLSAISPSYPVAISITGPLVTVLTLAGGFFANIGELPGYISWVQYISWFRYGFEAFSISQWEGAFSSSRAKKILESYSFNSDRFLFDIIALILFIFCVYFIGFIGLSIRVRRSR